MYETYSLGDEAVFEPDDGSVPCSHWDGLGPGRGYLSFNGSPKTYLGRDFLARKQ